MREDTKSLEEHLKEDFQTVQRAQLDLHFSQRCWTMSGSKPCEIHLKKFGDRIPNPDGSRPQVFVDVLEHKPDLILSALSNKRLLDFAEMIVGPMHVQLESITYRRTAPQDPNTNPGTGFSPGHVRRISSRRHLP